MGMVFTPTAGTKRAKAQRSTHVNPYGYCSVTSVIPEVTAGFIMLPRAVTVTHQNHAVYVWFSQLRSHVVKASDSLAQLAEIYDQKKRETPFVPFDVATMKCLVGSTHVVNNSTKTMFRATTSRLCV